MARPTAPVTLVLVLALALILAAPPAAAQTVSVEARLDRLERLVSSGTLMELLDRVNDLEKEVRSLRGQVEEQAHQLEQLGERQRELYLDVDGRLRRMEQGAAAASAPEGPAAGAEEPEPAGEGQPEPPPAGADPLAEQAAYQGAFQLLREGAYDDAARAFREFLAAHPDSGYADNARYWLGEAYYVTREFEKALEEFQALLAAHPESSKRTHALLKIGFAQDELGNDAEARRVLETLVQDHPGTTAARLAAERLETLD